MGKAFFIDIFEGHHKAIAHRYMMGSFESLKYAYFRAMRKLLFLALLPAMLLLLLYITYVMQMSLASRSTALWTYIMVIAFIQEVALLQPLKILMRWTVINGVVSADIRKTVFDFRDRSRIILIRKSGVMRDSNALVQHFNPACRAARMFPELPISRVLMTVSDFDVPTQPPKSLLMRLQAALFTVAMAAALLPVSLQDPLFEIIYILIINGVMLGLYLYSTINLAVTNVILVVVFGLLASRESIIRFFERQAAERARRKANENMFYEVEQDNIMDQTAFSDEKKKKAKREGRDYPDDESKDGSVYLNELDMASPDATLQGIDEGDDYGDDLDAEISPMHRQPPQEAKPIWGSPTIHAMDGLGSDFVGSIAYETNRPIAPIKGPPISASNFRIYGPATTGDKGSIENDYEEKKAAGTLVVPPADGTRGGGLAGLATGAPSLMEVLEKNPTIFAAAETGRRSLPDDYDSDNDSAQSSVGPYTKRLGKREVRAGKENSRRTERAEMGGHTRRSRKRTQERSKRIDADRGPGGRKHDGNEEGDGDEAEPHLYMTEEEREAWKEEQRAKKEEEQERAKEERRRIRHEEKQKEKAKERRRREREIARENGEMVSDSPESAFSGEDPDAVEGETPAEAKARRAETKEQLRREKKAQRKAERQAEREQERRDYENEMANTG